MLAHFLLKLSCINDDINMLRRWTGKKKKKSFRPLWLICPLLHPRLSYHLSEKLRSIYTQIQVMDIIHSPEKEKEITAQRITHFCQHAVDYSLSTIVHSAGMKFGLWGNWETSGRVVICLKDLDFQQEGKGKPWKDLTLSISPTFKYF